ncbi:hypothetical protein MBLNU230_g8436t1 [Neophaeotheca triangularis]
MAETVANGDAEQDLDLVEARQVLLSPSTRQRISELHHIHEKLPDLPKAQRAPLLKLLFETYPLYVDTRSRQAVERCLSLFASGPDAQDLVVPFSNVIEKEAAKPAIAPANAFTLVRWTSLFLQAAASNKDVWEGCGTRLLNALNNALNTLLASNPKESTKSTAFRVSRRAFRVLFKADFGAEAIDTCVQHFATKGPAPTPKNALPLGIIAGVCKRLPDRTEQIEAHKADFFAFYLREILGSRVQLPWYIASSLADFFSSYVSIDDLRKEIVPGVEKSLLRAPEVVLNDLVAPMIASLPPSLDFSEVLADNLLKPLLSSTKSTNAAVRSGAFHTFEVAAKRCHDSKSLEKILEDILTPLKTNKVASADQRTAHANMIGALEATNEVALKASAGLIATAAKEPNEAAASAEVAAASRFISYGLNNGLSLDKSIHDAFSKGLAEKKLPMRRVWALQFADTIWSLPEESLNGDTACDFADAGIPKLIDAFNEVIANPMPATQNGQAAIACATVALASSKVPAMSNLKSLAAVKKAGIAEKALATGSKPSFLFSPRVYSKMTAKEDIQWLLRALQSTLSKLTPTDEGDDASIAWAQALIFTLTSGNLSALMKKDASNFLQTMYLAEPEKVAKLVAGGLWQWCEDAETEAKDSAAVAAKTGRSELFRVVQSICLAPETVEKSGLLIPKEVLQDQMTRLLVLCRQQLIPRALWIELCLRTNVDPGQLASEAPEKCLASILAVTEDPAYKPLVAFQSAACGAAAELAFVAPDAMTPLIVSQIRRDLDPSQLAEIGPTEAAIYRTPEGTAFVDVLSKQGPSQPISKNTKDYDTLKWEEELRAQLAQKKGQAKKLTADEQAKVTAQLSKESGIRAQVADINDRLRRGIGIISALSVGPPTEAETWFGPSVQLLFEVIQAGAGLILGDAAALGYLLCADRISNRLGPLRSFVGVATLRAAGITTIPENLLAEPLGDLVTRLLYRLRSLGEQRPFDTVSLSYIFALMFLVLGQGGIDRPAGEDADEQMMLAMDFLSFHTDTCSNTHLPRQQLLSLLIDSMMRHTQHFKALKDCFSDLCRSIAPNTSEPETNTIVQGAIVPDTSVRGAVLQAISAELDLEDREFYEEVWLACHDDVDEHVDIAHEIWEENELKVAPDSVYQLLPYLESKDAQLRRATARAVAAATKQHPSSFEGLLNRLQETYIDRAKEKIPKKDKYGMLLKQDLSDPWEARHGIALALRELAPVFPPDHLVPFMHFLVESGPLGDRSNAVRDAMVNSAVTIISAQAQTQVEALMKLCESTLESSTHSSAAQDAVNEAVVILYGALARHLPPGDERVPAVVQRLLSTLNTPSESVQYAVAQCLPPLVRASKDKATKYLQQMIDETLHSKKYAARRGAAYGLAGVVKGRGIAALRESRVVSTLKGASENKKDINERQGAFLAFELMSLLLGRVFEPYVIQIVPQLLAGFGDASADVRDACLDAAKTCFASLSSFGVKEVLPMLLEGLEEQQWRSKKGACDSLGAMAYLDPQQLAVSLPDIIPPLTDVLNDSHKEVRASANRSLQRFGEVISNPEVKSQVNILLKALSDPTKYTDDALDALIKVSFIHYLDAPSLALVVRILERGLGDRSATKRKASQIIGSLAHLTERRDLVNHLPILVAGLRIAIVDPVPTTRATASKALGSTIEKLGEDALPDLIPSLMATLKSDSGAGDRLGSAQALSEVLAGLGTSRLEDTLPTILQNVSSSKASVREGFMSLFIFLPACFGNSFSNYLGRIIPPILAGLADDIESIRETALRAGRLLVKNFATRSIDLLLPELERGLADDNYRIRLSSVELVGDLLFNLTGISGKTEAEDVEETAQEAGASLLEVLGEERRNKVLSALYICRNDTSGLVRTAAVNVWKALVSSPRTLRELIPTLTQFLIRRLASSNMEQKVIAGNALGELIRKAGEGVLATLLPTLEEGLQTSTDTDARQGICIALRELIGAASPDSLEDYEKTLIQVVRTALVDSDGDVREAAAEAFDSLQRAIGKRVVDQVLPYLLNLLRAEDTAQNALSALLTLLTETTRSNIILPNLLPTLLTTPISAFNARALASLSQVAGSSMTRRLPTILNSLMDSIVSSKDEELRADLERSFDAILQSVDEYDGLNTMMSVMLAMIKHDDHRKRARADLHLAKFFAEADVDYSRYYPDLIRGLLLAFDDSDPEVVKAAWTALSALTQHLRKEEMESLVSSTKTTLNQVGVAGHNLPGFSLPKGINAILPIFLQGLMNGSAEQRTQAALAISDLIDRTSPEGLKPFVTNITGPLIRVVSERSVELKAAILLTLNNLLQKVPAALRPFLPQLQRTFAKSLADPSSEVLRSRAAKALGTLITMTPRIDPLIAELVTGSKTSDTGVRNAMLKALYEVVSKAGANMNEVSRNSILGLIDSDTADSDDTMNITFARLLGALIRVLPADSATALIKQVFFPKSDVHRQLTKARSRVLTTNFTNPSILALNSVLLESPESLTSGALGEVTPQIISQGIGSKHPFIADNAVLAAGKYLLTPSSNKSFDACKPLFEALATVIAPGNSVDSRRLSLVVVRTISREDNDMVRPHLPLLTPPIFASVRDPVIPVKLSAEAAFLGIFNVVEEEGAVFEKYMAGPGAELPPGQKRSMQEYFKRVALRLSGQARERKEAEGGQGGLGLSSDEREDEREVWSVGKVDLGEGNFNE